MSENRHFSSKIRECAFILFIVDGELFYGNSLPAALTTIDTPILSDTNFDQFGNLVRQERTRRSNETSAASISGALVVSPPVEEIIDTKAEGQPLMHFNERKQVSPYSDLFTIVALVLRDTADSIYP